MDEIVNKQGKMLPERLRLNTCTVPNQGTLA